MNEAEMKQFIAEKLAEDMTLSEIQKALNEKFNSKLTFMEVRILASELDNIDWDKNSKKEETKKEENAEPTEPEKAEVPADSNGKTVIEMSKIDRPGIMASGSVKFISGATAEWIIDNTGRCGLDKVVGQPTQDDFMDFQTELQKLFS